MKQPFESVPTARRRAPLEQVAGERAAPVIARALSLQAQISNILTAVLVLVLGGGLLLWYYTHQLTRPARARQGAQIDAARLAATEMPLPPLGPIRPPPAPIPSADTSATATAPVATPATAQAASTAPGASRSVGSGLPLSPLPQSPLLLALPETGTTPALALAAGLKQSTPGLGSPAQAIQDPRLVGPAFVALGSSSSSLAADSGAAADSTISAGSMANSGNAGAASGSIGPPTPLGSGSSGAASATAFTPSRAVRATASDATDLWQGSAPVSAPHLLPTQSLLLPKGAFIDCTLETAIDSTLPGMTSCITATDTFGADGRVVLLERGTKLVGETQGQVQQGAARVFVLWSEARTPLGVVVPLESPSADELGRSGLPGTVQRHFWERFGAAIMVSTIDGAVQAAVQSSSRNDGTVIYNPGASQDVMTEVLKNTVAIPPTVVKQNGDRIQVLVARDVDFRAVYELHRAGYER